MSLILAEFSWQFALVAIQRIVNEWNTRNPVAFGEFAMGLKVVLATSEIPHKITPVHEVHLITEEELKVLAEGWAVLCLCLSTIVIFNAFTLNISPRFIGIHMVRLRRVHTGEEHLKLVHIHIRVLVTRNHITVLLTVLFGCWCILRMSLFLYRHAHIALDIQLNRRIVGLSVEQWCIAILLAVEVVLEREDIIWRVLIHRCVRIGANNNSCIASIANHHHCYHHGDRIEPTCRDHFFL